MRAGSGDRRGCLSSRHFLQFSFELLLGSLPCGGGYLESLLLFGGDARQHLTCVAGHFPVYDCHLLWGQLAPLEHLLRERGEDLSVQSVEPRPILERSLFVLLLISGLVGVNQREGFYSPCRIRGELRAEVSEEGIFSGHRIGRLNRAELPLPLISGGREKVFRKKNNPPPFERRVVCRGRILSPAQSGDFIPVNHGEVQPMPQLPKNCIDCLGVCS